MSAPAVEGPVVLHLAEARGLVDKPTAQRDEDDDRVDEAVRQRAEDLEALDRLYAWAWTAPEEEQQEADAATEASALTRAVVDRGILVASRAATARSRIAERCFSEDPTVARKALVYLRRILENQPVGHPDVACGLFTLVQRFIEQVPPSRFASLSLELSARMLQCLFLVLEALRAEHLVGNLPAISQEQRDGIWTYAEELEALNVKAKQDTLLDEAADVEMGLWVEVLIQSAKRLKTPESKLAGGLKAVAGTAGAAIKVYQGDVVSGLAQLKDTFRRSTVLLGAWFEDLVVLRRLVSDAVRDEYLFRQLKWTIANSMLLKSASETASQPRFLMHVILCLERLVLEGASEFIREEAFQLLTNYALSSNMYLQLTAARCLQNLCEVEHGEKIQATARVVLRIVVATQMQESDHERVRNAAERIQRQWEDQEVDRRAGAARRGLQGTAAADEFHGYSSVIASLIEYLNDGHGDIPDGETLICMASKVTSHHASLVTQVLKEAVYFGESSAEYFQRPSRESGLTPVHEAAKSGVCTNLEWMFSSTTRGEAEKLATLRTASGKQPIHLAGSVEVLRLLIEYKARLDAIDDDENTVLHTLDRELVLAEVLSMLKTAEYAGLGVDLDRKNKKGFPPLLCARNAAVTETLLEHAADVNQKGGTAFNQGNALLAAALADNADVCSALLAAKVDVMYTDVTGKNALHYAGDSALQCLLASPLREQVNARSNAGLTPLHTARSGLVIRELLSFRANVNAKCDRGETPLVTAGDVQAKVEVLLAHGADPMAHTADGDSFFLDSCRKGRQLIVQAMLADKATAKELLATRAKNGADAVHNAGMFGSWSLLQTLREAGADLASLNLLTGEPCSAIYHITVAWLCFSYGVDPNLRNSIHGTTALMTIIDKPYYVLDVSVEELIIKWRCDPCAVDNYGRSVFTHWCGQPWPYLQLLLDHRADPLASEAQHPLVPRWAQAEMYFEEGPQHAVVELSRLLALRCDIDAVGVDRRSALSFAAQAFKHDAEGRPQALEALLQAKADAMKADVFGRVPLHYAVANTKAPLEAARLLFDYCARAAAVHDMAGETPVKLAERLGLDDVVAYVKKGHNTSLALAGAAELVVTHRRNSVALGEESSDPFLLAKLGREEAAKQALQGHDLSSMCDHSTGDSILHAAVQGGCLGLVRYVLDRAPALVMDRRGILQRTPLHRLGTLEVQPPQAEAIARALVQARADPLEQLRGQHPASIVVDCAGFSPGVVKVLLEGKVSPDEFCASNKRWIWSDVRHAEVVELLLAAKSCLECPDASGTTAIMLLAQKQGGVAGLKTLLKHAPAELAVSKVKGTNDTCLTMAGRVGAHRAVDLLVQARADVNATTTSGLTALALNSENPRARMVRALLANAADPNLADMQKQAPMHRLLGKLLGAEGREIFDLLLAARADLQARDEAGAPAALAAAPIPECLARALELKVPVDIEAPRTGLNFALAAVSSKAGSVSGSLKMLQDRGVDVLSQRRRSDGQHLVHIAAALSSEETFAYVLDLAKSDPRLLLAAMTAQDQKGETVFHKTSAYKYSRGSFAKKSEMLLAACREVPQVAAELQRIVNIKNKDKRGPMDGVENIHCVRLLLEAKADARRSMAFFTNAGQRRNFVLLDLLLESGADINLCAADDGEAHATPLQSILWTGDLVTAREWIKRGADVLRKDASGDSSMMYAPTPSVVAFLQARQVDINFQSPLTGDTLLHRRCAQGNLQMVRHILLTLEGKVHRNSQGQTLLHVAARHGHADTLGFLIEQGFDTEDKDRDGQTPLHLGVKSGHTAITQTLLRATANVHALDDVGQTPLFEAVRNGSHPLYQMLLGQRASPLVSTTNKSTLLHLAAKRHHLKLVELLLQLADLDVNQKTTDLEVTALHLAVRSQRDAVVKILMASPRTRLDVPDKKGRTAVAMAAEGSLSILQTIVTARPFDAALLQTAMLSAVGCGNREACGFLMKECAVKLRDCVDEAGNNALHLAAKSGDAQMARWLLEQWGDGLAAAMSARNAEGMAPGEVAEVRDHERVLRALTVARRAQGGSHDVHSDIKTQRKEGGWLCCTAGNDETAELVVSQLRPDSMPANIAGALAVTAGS